MPATQTTAAGNTRPGARPATVTPSASRAGSPETSRARSRRTSRTSANGTGDSPCPASRPKSRTSARTASTSPAGSLAKRRSPIPPAVLVPPPLPAVPKIPAPPRAGAAPCAGPGPSARKRLATPRSTPAHSTGRRSPASRAPSPIASVQYETKRPSRSASTSPAPNPSVPAGQGTSPPTRASASGIAYPSRRRRSPCRHVWPAVSGSPSAPR